MLVGLDGLPSAFHRKLPTLSPPVLVFVSPLQARLDATGEEKREAAGPETGHRLAC